jgi:hypothetical protein
MESIVSKVYVEFQQALFTILDKKIRIKDLEQSKKLRDEIVQLSKDVKPTKLAWLYLDQLKKQDRCFAEQTVCLSTEQRSINLPYAKNTLFVRITS